MISFLPLSKGKLRGNPEDAKQEGLPPAMGDASLAAKGLINFSEEGKRHGYFISGRASLT
jgi:hypothetical protein